MARLLIRNLDDQLLVRLRRRAERNDRSVEAEVRAVLIAAVDKDGLGTRIARRFAGIGLRPGEELEPLPRQAPRPAHFDE